MFLFTVHVYFKVTLNKTKTMKHYKIKTLGLFLFFSITMLNCSGLLPVTVEINGSKPVYFGNYDGFDQKFTLQSSIEATDFHSQTTSESTSGNVQTSSTYNLKLTTINRKISESLQPSSAFVNNLNLTIKNSVTNWGSVIKMKNSVAMNANVLKGE